MHAAGLGGEAGLSEEGDPLLILGDWMSVKTTMWNYAGIVRTRRALHTEEALVFHVGQQSAGNRKALLLTTRKRRSAFTDRRVIAIGELHNEVVCLGSFCGGDDLLIRCV